MAAGSDARLHLRFAARRVFLVLGSPAEAAEGRGDCSTGARRPIRVDRPPAVRDRALPRPGAHLLTLSPERGDEAYAFTFG